MATSAARSWPCPPQRLSPSVDDASLPVALAGREELLARRRELRPEAFGLPGDVGEVALERGVADRLRFLHQLLQAGRRLLEGVQAGVGFGRGVGPALERGVRLRGPLRERVAPLEEMLDKLRASLDG